MDERTWQSIHTLSKFMLVHAHLLDVFKYHAVLYAIEAFSVVAVKYLRTKTNEPKYRMSYFTTRNPAWDCLEFLTGQFSPINTPLPPKLAILMELEGTIDGVTRWQQMRIPLLCEIHQLRGSDCKMMIA
jgi:hypothetical protein